VKDDDLKVFLEGQFANIDQRITEAQQLTHTQIKRLEGKVNTLWHRVEGSLPPDMMPSGSSLIPIIVPPSEPRLPIPRPDPVKPKGGLTKQVTDHSMELAAVNANLNVLTDQVGALTKLTKVQTTAMGISPTKAGETDERSAGQKFGDFLTWLMREREGQKFALAALAAITGLVTAIGTSYAIITGRLPMPTSPAPTHIQSPP